jgi:hypothetical protein
MQRHTHNTRLTPEKAQHGGARTGAGRPRGKKNHDPNVVDTVSIARQHRWTDSKEKAEYKQEQDELINPKGTHLVVP